MARDGVSLEIALAGFADFAGADVVLSHVRDVIGLVCHNNAYIPLYVCVGLPVLSVFDKIVYHGRVGEC